MWSLHEEVAQDGIFKAIACSYVWTKNGCWSVSGVMQKMKYTQYRQTAQKEKVCRTEWLQVSTQTWGVQTDTFSHIEFSQSLSSGWALST